MPEHNDFDPDTPGIGFDYSWDPDAINGTWESNSGGTTLPAGSYESEQTFANLHGCPLNGVWQIEICDLLAADNGFVFDFGINFTNGVGPGCTDSSACNYNDISANDGSCTNLMNAFAEKAFRGYCDAMEINSMPLVFAEKLRYDISNNGLR